eukprot:g45688.t1
MWFRMTDPCVWMKKWLLKVKMLWSRMKRMCCRMASGNWQLVVLIEVPYMGIVRNESAYGTLKNWIKSLDQSAQLPGVSFVARSVLYEVGSSFVIKPADNVVIGLEGTNNITLCLGDGVCYLHIVDDDEHLAKIFPMPPLLTFKQPPNLKQTIDRSKLPSLQDNVDHTIKPCHGNLCKTCQIFDMDTTVTRGTTHHVHGRCSCDLVNVVYPLRCSQIQLAFFSDYCLLLANCHLLDNQRAGKGMWKLNGKHLTPENIEELKRDNTRWRTMKPHLELYNIKPTDSAGSPSFLFSITEFLDNSTQEMLDQPFSLDELTKALDSLEKNKTPGSDGLTAELYSALWDLTGWDLLKLYDSTLLIDTMYESTRKAHRLMSICDWIELASGDKVNQGKSMFFGKWADRSFIPFTVRTDFRMVLGICCIKLCIDPQYGNTKCHYTLRFYLSLVLQRMGLASLPRTLQVFGPFCITSAVNQRAAESYHSRIIGDIATDIMTVQQVRQNLMS